MVYEYSVGNAAGAKLTEGVLVLEFRSHSEERRRDESSV